MNMQAMMKQAQKMQKDMMNAKKEIDETMFEGSSGNIKVSVMGNKEVKDIKINMENIENDDIEMIEDMLVVAINDAIKKIDAETEKKLGKFTNGMPGLF